MIRLQKIIAQNSNISRRKAEELITQKKVLVNNQVITELGTKIHGNEEIIVDGKILFVHEKLYFLINKPKAVISSRNDNLNRLVITDLINTDLKIYPIGRLDYNTTGLLLLTNDGELANGLMHPKSKIGKTYIAKVKGKYTIEDLYKLRQGINIENYQTLPATIKTITYNPKTEVGKIKITIFEGKNLQIKKMFKAINCTVLDLKRVEYAFFNLDHEKLSLGHYRSLKVKEIQKLYSLIK